jgi:hypothetical protein
MIRVFKYIFFPEWKLVWHRKGDWNIIKTYLWGEKFKETDSCNFYIYYSKIRNNYKLVINGFAPKEHPDYESAVGELIKLQSTI